MRFEHIGYAVEKIDAFVEAFLKPVLRPVSIGPTYEDPIQRVRVAFVVLEGGARIELIEPMGPGSPVSQVLSRRRGGVAHLCFAVENLEDELALMRSYGCVMFAGPVPAAAFEGRRIAFVLSPFADVLELVEECEGRAIAT